MAYSFIALATTPRATVDTQRSRKIELEYTLDRGGLISWDAGPLETSLPDPVNPRVLVAADRALVQNLEAPGISEATRHIAVMVPFCTKLLEFHQVLLN